MDFDTTLTKKNLPTILTFTVLALSIPITVLIYERLADTEDVSQTESEAATWTLNDLSFEQGATTKVIDHSSEACGEKDIPDAPPKAFVDDSNKVQIIASHYVSYRNIGDNLDSATHDCGTRLFSSHKDADPRMYNDYEWLMSPYTLNGKDIYALVHTEYHGFEHNNCTSGNIRNCWWNSINLAYSTNSGATYTHAQAPNHNVLNTNSDYSLSNTFGAVGLMEPSNIIKNGNYYYFLVTNRNPISERSGTCVARSDNISNRLSWQLWDGSGFNLSGDHVDCPTVPNGISAHNISYNTYLEKFLALRCQWGTCWITVSDDLINWESRKEFGNYCMYASFIQPGDPTRNFEQTGRSPWIYYMKCNDCGNCSMDRDLVRTRVRFTKPGDESKYELLDLQFNERRGNKALDSSFYVNNATISGTHTWRQGSGKLYLNVAQDASLTVSHQNSLNASGNITIKGALRTSQKPATGKFGIIVLKQDGTKRNYGLFLNDQGKLHFSLNEGSGYKGTLSQSSIADGQWHTFAVTFSDMTKAAKYFIDGQLDVSTTINATLQNSRNNAPVKVGSSNFQGDLDYLTILNYINASCTPNCSGKECGNDGCGGSCGTCPTGETCNASGTCEGCTPNCSGKECGNDGCGGSCGTCPTGKTCNASGTCEGCTPNCSGKECGNDGCGGSCGTCPTGETCNSSGTCVAGSSSKADINGDGTVSMSDYSLFVQDYFDYRNDDDLHERSDLNDDNKISMIDYSIFVEEYLETRS